MDKAMNSRSIEGERIARLIKQWLDNKELKIISLDSCDSTNSVAAEYAQNGACEFTTVISSSQSAGRGRLGRSFFSPENTGLYMSMILRPGTKATNALGITTLAAVATANVIKRYSDKRIGIKWVNDIYADNKKVCGILTTGSVNSATGDLSYAILGIGVNLFMPKDGFPEDIRDTASSVFDRPYDTELKAEFVSGLINELLCLYPMLGEKGIVEKYRDLSIIPGHDIFVLSGDEKLPAKAISVGDDYSLLVRFENGSLKALNTGDISIRLK